MTRTIVTLGERTFAIIGTAHISEQSVHDVETAITELHPDRICVELDEDRYKNLTNPNHWKSMNISTLIRQRKAMFMLASLVLSAFQRRLGADVRAGEDMLAAIRLAEEHEIPCEMIDRKVNATLLRVWRKSRFFQKNKMLAVLLSLIFEKRQIEKEEIEKLKEHVEIDYMITELTQYLPSVKHILIDERDSFLAHKLYHAEGSNILAVVGAGHVRGMVRIMESIHAKAVNVDMDELSSIPPPGFLSRLLPWIIPAIVVFFIGRGFMQQDWQRVLGNLWQWILINGSLAAAGALFALAHPLTIITTFLAAPLTSLNPTIGVGMVSGILESVFRKPRVIDFERVYTDIGTFRGWFRNRIAHILLVFLLSTVGSAVGTFIALPFLMF